MTKDKDFYIAIERGEVSFNTKHGAEIYRRSLSILLECAIHELYPKASLHVGQTLMNGYFYEINGGERLTDSFIDRVTARMRKIISEDEKFKKIKMKKARALRLCRKYGRDDKYKAVRYLPDAEIEIVFLRGYFDFMLAETVLSAGSLRTFRLIKYNHGFILQFPARGDIEKLPAGKDRQRKLYKVYMETKEWNRILGIQNAGDLNCAIADGSSRTLINVQEAFHERKIVEIANMIKNSFPRKRLICVAGPSSSGKTTFIKRLGVQLRADGLRSTEISLDNYFHSREKTPRTKDGDYDFESVRALDLKFLRHQMGELLDGKEIGLQEYDFKQGRRKSTGCRLRLERDSLVLIEGIHALNPAILPNIPSDKFFRIFVSALTQLGIDNDNRIFTSDSRLIRRIVRDNKFRGYSASDSIKRFPKVREGEDRYIFPFQRTCDVFFNSSLIYEQAVLKPLVEKLLNNVKKTDDSYFEARRLLYYLRFFLPIPSKRVPHNSILREFIGESAFHY